MSFIMDLNARPLHLPANEISLVFGRILAMAMKNILQEFGWSIRVSGKLGWG